MMPDLHDDFLDLTAVLALGALPEAEARRVAGHLATCDACRALYAELRPAADLVGYSEEASSLDEVTSARMKSNIMRVVRGVDVQRPASRRKPSFGWFAATAAAILAAVIGVDDYAARDRAARSNDAERTSVAAARTQLAAAQAQLAGLETQRATVQAHLAAIQQQRVTAQTQLAAAQTQRATTQTELAAAQTQLVAARTQLATSRNDVTVSESRLVALLVPGGKHFAVPQGEVVTNAGRVLIALKLAALPPGKVYQAWTLAKGAKAVTPSVTFSPAASGVAFVELPIDAAGIAAVAVSVEPAGGSKAPTSTPKFIRPLS